MGDIVLTETYCATGYTACESSYPEGHPQCHATHKLEAQKVHFRREEGPIVCDRATHEDTRNTMLPTYNQKSHRGCRRAMKTNDEGYLNRTDQPLFQKTCLSCYYCAGVSECTRQTKALILEIRHMPDVMHSEVKYFGSLRNQSNCKLDFKLLYGGDSSPYWLVVLPKQIPVDSNVIQ